MMVYINNVSEYSNQLYHEIVKALKPRQIQPGYKFSIPRSSDHDRQVTVPNLLPGSPIPITKTLRETGERYLWSNYPEGAGTPQPEVDRVLLVDTQGLVSGDLVIGLNHVNHSKEVRSLYLLLHSSNNTPVPGSAVSAYYVGYGTTAGALALGHFIVDKIPRIGFSTGELPSQFNVGTGTSWGETILPFKHVATGSRATKLPAWDTERDEFHMVSGRFKLSLPENRDFRVGLALRSPGAIWPGRGEIGESQRSRRRGLVNAINLNVVLSQTEISVGGVPANFQSQCRWFTFFGPPDYQWAPMSLRYDMDGAPDSMLWGDYMLRAHVSPIVVINREPSVPVEVAVVAVALDDVGPGEPYAQSGLIAFYSEMNEDHWEGRPIRSVPFNNYPHSAAKSRLAQEGTLRREVILLRQEILKESRPRFSFTPTYEIQNGSSTWGAILIVPWGISAEELP